MISFPSWAQVALQVLVIMQPRAVADTAPIDLVDTQIGTAAGGKKISAATVQHTLTGFEVMCSPARLCHMVSKYNTGKEQIANTICRNGEARRGCMD